jgi:transcription initiation factor IIE alpha subunit
VFYYKLLLEHLRIYNYLKKNYYTGVKILTCAFSERITELDEINSEMVDYMSRHGKVKAGELAALVGITVPSIRVRLFHLMALGIISQEKTRDHHVWFFLKEEKS